MTTAQVRIPDKLADLFAPARGDLAFRCAYGGRGSGKSFTFALMAAIWGMVEPLRILCVREFQASIKESFHAELKNAIESMPWLAAHYDVGVDYLRGKNGTEFIFRGLRHNTSGLKSLAQIDLTIVEEGEDTPGHSWLALLPTVFRTDKSETWVIWNPEVDGSPTDQRFRKEPPDRCMAVEVNYTDNPWFPPGLEAQRLHDLKTMDPATYAWIWEGAYRQNSEAQIFANKFHTAEFTPGASWNGPYYGLDFGFSLDPTAGVKCWAYDQRLYIEYEAGRIGLELDQTAEYVMQRLPGIEHHTVRSDSARPESISYLKRHGLPRIVGVKKGKGSVEDGIAHMKSYRDIVIHPRCKEVRREFLTYSHKLDKLSGDPLPDIIDANNHYIDAIRYALEPIMKAKSGPRIA